MSKSVGALPALQPGRRAPPLARTPEARPLPPKRVWTLHQTPKNKPEEAGATPQTRPTEEEEGESIFGALESGGAEARAVPLYMTELIENDESRTRHSLVS